MRCASVLLDARHLDAEGDKSEQNHGDGDGVCLSDEDIYDAPRGLYRAPVRRDISEDEDDWEWNDSGESMAVMQGQGVKSKMVKSKGGQEMFFSVVTKR
jgi:hypothetical protein